MPHRILIVSYYWPPSGGSGVQRWLKLAKYLSQLGWEVLVAVPEAADYVVRDESLRAEVPDAVQVLSYPIREPYAAFRAVTGAKATDVLVAPKKAPGLLKRLALWIRANWFVPDPKVLWVRPTAKALTQLLHENPVDVVVTTGPPHSIHLIGQRLKRAFPDVLWAMDVRDPWSQFDVHLAFNPGARARAKNRRLERQALQQADLVLGTAYSMPAHLEPFDANKFVAVTNGYDAEDFAEVLAHAETKTRNTFHLYHTGLLNAARNPVAVWRALNDLVLRDPSFAERLHVYLIGTVAPEVQQSIAAYPALTNKVTVEGWMSHDQLVQRYGDADAFLLCPNRSDNAKGQINGKLFEYLAMRKPVLHVGPYDADNTRILDEAHAGLTVLPGDADGMLDALQRLVSGTFGATPHAFNPTVIARYERKATATFLSETLKNRLTD